MNPPLALPLPRSAAEWTEENTPSTRAEWHAERERLLELLAQQQRVAQAGLLTAGLAHDVNNHVQAITGNACLALYSQRPEDWRTALEKTQDRCRDLAETTTAFLSFLRRRNEAEIARFRLSEVLGHTHRMVKSLAKRHGITLTLRVQRDAEIAGERRLAIQALVNLVTNAIRACAEGGSEIWITADRVDAETSRIAVADDGPGIPAELRGRLFKPFATGYEGAGGHGLGLFIVRQCAEKLGGGVRLQASSPEGTTFAMDLPRATV